MTTNNTTTEPQTPAEIGHRPGHFDAARFYGDLREADSLLDSLRPIMREIDNLKGAYSKQRIAASDSLDACIDEVIQ